MAENSHIFRGIRHPDNGLGLGRERGGRSGAVVGIEYDLGRLCCWLRISPAVEQRVLPKEGRRRRCLDFRPLFGDFLHALFSLIGGRRLDSPNERFPGFDSACSVFVDTFSCDSEMLPDSNLRNVVAVVACSSGMPYQPSLWLPSTLQ